MKGGMPLAQTSNFLIEQAQDLRLYFWMPSEYVGFLQAVIDAEDHLARIRTERQKDDRALILLMCDLSREKESRDLLRYAAEELEIQLEFVDSIL
jgi:hypothetical protein